MDLEVQQEQDQFLVVLLKPHMIQQIIDILQMRQLIVLLQGSIGMDTLRQIH
jgi:hypothetical protein